MRRRCSQRLATECRRIADGADWQADCEEWQDLKAAYDAYRGRGTRGRNAASSAGGAHSAGASSPARPRARRCRAAGRRTRAARPPASRTAVATSSSWCGESEQAGSVASARPVIANAWQRQPPKSVNRRGQLRQGSCIQSVPRNALNAAPRYQISASGRSLTLSKRERRDAFRGVAGQDLARRRDVQVLPRPAAHAGLGIARVVVGHHVVDHEHALEPLARRLDQRDRALGLLAGRHQRRAVGERPAVVLDVGDLEAPGAELDRELDDPRPGGRGSGGARPR